MFARLSRIVPMLIVLAVVAAIVYIVAAWRYSPNRAKELLIRIFTAITGAVSAFFLLVCAYAWLERNGAVFDLSFSFLLTALIGLAVTRICRAVFCATTPRTASRPRRRRLRVPVSGVGGRNRKTLLRGFEMRWRRAGDSNPRHPFGVYSLSRRAPSASRSALRGIIGAVCYDTVTTSKLQGA